MPRGVIATPGYPFVLGGVILVLLGWALGSWPLTLVGLAGGGFFAYFFRDPERVVPVDPAAVVSPADGKVVILDEVREEEFLQAPAKRLAIFMNVFDVHINRAPVSGTVVEAKHRAGEYQAAYKAEAGWRNEQRATLLERQDGRRVLVVQIAGLLARRIVPFVQPGSQVVRGERLGMICFGSRVDLYLPPDCQILVKVGERVRAGSSVVARWG